MFSCQCDRFDVFVNFEQISQPGQPFNAWRKGKGHSYLNKAAFKS